MKQTMTTTYQIYLGRDVPLPQLGHEVEGVVTGDMLAEFLIDTVTRYFKSWTLTEGVSSWKGNAEDVFILTIIGDTYENALEIRAIANEYKKRFLQEAVLINSYRSDTLLIE
jgi:hypothetical protein